MRLLSDEDLILEPQTARHAEALYALLDDAALYPFAGVPPRSVEQLRERLLGLEAARSPDGLALWLNWVLRHQGQLLGYVQATVFCAPDGQRTAWVAYVLGSAHGGQGWATRGVRRMQTELHDFYGVQRLAATVARANTKSLALLRRLGYREVPADDVLRQGAGPEESVLARPAVD
jgi:ribosomal-protein-alanine N-acetyltransferase